MGHDPGRGGLRNRIAHLAARLIAEDGVQDYAWAKRKAARQAGVPDTREWPANDEISAALKTYRELYHREHAGELRQLRELALDVMDEFSRFDPWLAGAVLNGSAGRFSAIEIHAIADSAKDAELYLLNQGTPYRSGARRLYAGRDAIEAPVLTFSRNEVEIHLTVLSPRDARVALKTSPEGRTIERARRDAVAALLAAE